MSRGARYQQGIDATAAEVREYISSINARVETNPTLRDAAVRLVVMSVWHEELAQNMTNAAVAFGAWQDIHDPDHRWHIPDAIDDETAGRAVTLLRASRECADYAAKLTAQAEEITRGRFGSRGVH